MQREEEEFDLYEGLDFVPQATKLQTRQRPSPSSAKAPTSTAPSTTQVDIHPETCAETTAETSKVEADAAPVNSSLCAAGEDSDEDGLVLLGAEETIQLPEVSPAAPSTQSRKTRFTGVDATTRSSHFIRRERPLVLGVPPSLPLASEQEDAGHMLVVGSLPWWVGDLALREVCQSFGLRAVRVLSDPSGLQSSGVAILQFTSAASAEAAFSGIERNLSAYAVSLGATKPSLRVSAVPESLWRSLNSAPDSSEQSALLSQDSAEAAPSRIHWASGGILTAKEKAAIFALVNNNITNTASNNNYNNKTNNNNNNFTNFNNNNNHNHNASSFSAVETPTRPAVSSIPAPTSSSEGATLSSLVQMASLRPSVPKTAPETQSNRSSAAADEEEASSEPSGISALFPWFDPSVLEAGEDPGSSSSGESSATASNPRCSLPPTQTSHSQSQPKRRRKSSGKRLKYRRGGAPNGASSAHGQIPLPEMYGRSVWAPPNNPGHWPHRQ